MQIETHKTRIRSKGPYLNCHNRQSEFNTEGIKDYVLREKPGEHGPLAWISENVRFPSTAGPELYNKKVGPYLLDFQKEIIKGVLSPTYEIQKSLWLIGSRKVSKSLIFSFITFAVVANKKHGGLQIALCGVSRGQGEVIFKMLKEIVSLSPIKDNFNIRRDHIENKLTKARVFAVYNTPSSNMGLQCSGAIGDDLAHHRSADNLDSILTSMSLAKNPLRLFSSNPPETSDHFVWQKLKEAESEGWIIKRFSIPKDKDVFNPESWRECNPFIDEYFNSGKRKFKSVFNFYLAQSKLAKQSGGKTEYLFRRYLCGQGVGLENSAFFSPDLIKIAPSSVLRQKGNRIAIGADISLSNDSTAIAIVATTPDDKIYCKPFLFYPLSGRSKNPANGTKV